MWTCLGLLSLGLILAGCPSAGIYRSARTLEQGESDFGMSFSATRITSSKTTTTYEGGNEEQSESPTIVIPNLIPELNYHVGMTDNLEIGGRIALSSGLMELDAKYRFLKAAGGKLHAAIQPAVGYRSFFVVEGVNFTLPLLVTYDVGDMLGINLFGYGNYMNWSPTDKDEFDEFALNAVSVGGGVGIEFRGETFHLMPTIDLSKTLINFDADSGASGSSSVNETTFVVFGINFGWYGGREIKKLKQMDEKLDRIEDKIDRNNR